MVRHSKRRAAAKASQKSGVLRPTAEVLSADALIPAANIVDPPPEEFSHELTRDEPYHFGSGTKGPPDGEFRRGTRVVVVTDDGHHAGVIDERGLYVHVRADSLRTRKSAPPTA
jgi:hypothetical protein